MRSYGIEIPDRPEDDVMQAMRDTRDEEIRRSLKPERLRTDILEQICLGMLTHGHAFNAMLQILLDAPIRDEFDLHGYLKYCAPRDAEMLGRALMQAAGEATLRQVREVDDAAF
jgi:hypothetical protein